MAKEPEKRFVIRKFIMAKSASEALKKEKKYKADECWIDEKWIDQVSRENNPAIGFSIERDNNEDY